MASEQKFQIFRAADAPGLDESGMMDIVHSSPMQADGFDRMFEAGLGDGSDSQVLVNIPGFNLYHLWLKKDFPLPLHRHNTDCVYYIVSGSLTLGTETLGPRDCFFVPADAPYTYQVGPEGLELLEIRNANHSDSRTMVSNPSYFDKAAVTSITVLCDEWRDAKRPPPNV